MHLSRGPAAKRCRVFVRKHRSPRGLEQKVVQDFVSFFLSDFNI